MRYIAWLFVILCVAIPGVAQAVTIDPNACSGQCIQTAITANPTTGTVFNLLAGTFTNQTFLAKNNDQFIGAGAGVTIFEGSGLNQQLTDGFNDNITGVTLKNFTVRHYYTHSAECTGAPLTALWNDWVIDHVDVTDNGCNGAYIIGNVHIIGGHWLRNGHSGINGTQVPSSPPAAVKFPAIIEKAEIASNNQGNDNINNDVGGIKVTTGQYTIQYNYVHDNTTSVGIWCDGSCTNNIIQYNTVTNNGGPGIMYEISKGNTSIFHNVVNNNGYASGLGSFWPAIYLSCANGTNVQGNNISVPNVSSAQGIIIQGWNHDGDCVIGNGNGFGITGDTLLNNIVTFVGSTGGHGLINQNASPTTGISSNNNTFHGLAADTHWYWGTGTALNFANYQASTYTGTTPDAGGSVLSGSAAVAGCTQMDCAVDPTTGGGTGGPPHTPSANGTCLTQGGPACALPGINGIITDSLGNDYTLVNLGANGFGIQINFQPNYTGAVADPCGGAGACTDHVIYLISLNGSMYQETSDTSWFVRNGDPSTVNWTATSNPISPLPPPPPAWTGTQRSLNSLLTAIFQAGQSQGIGSPDLRDLSVSADVGTPAVVTATGTNQLTALQLTEQFNIVTAGSVNTGVIANQGRTVVWNMTGNAILVYPEAGASLTYTTTAAPTPTTLRANLPITLPVGSIAQINMVNGTQGYARVW